MTQPPPPPYDNSYGYAPIDTSKDAEHLKILSICWYIIGGLECLGSCAGLVYVVIGIAAISGGFGPQHPGDPPPALFGGIFTCVGVFFLALSLTLAFLSFKVARSLVARRSRTLCFVMAAIVCLSVPLGTLLGVFTLVVLSRPSVKESFT